MENKNFINTADHVRKVEADLYCHLLRILPEDGTAIHLRQMTCFLNKDSNLCDALKLVAVRTPDHGRHVQLTSAAIDYDKTTLAAEDISATADCFLPEEAQALRCDTADLNNVKLLYELVDAVQRALSARKVNVGCFDRTSRHSTLYHVILDPGDKGAAAPDRYETYFDEKTVAVDGLKGLDEFVRSFDKPASHLKVITIHVF